MLEKITTSFTEAYEQNADALFRYAFFNVSNRELAKDLVQETFTKTWDYVASGKVITNLKAFLYKIMKNLIIDYYRSKKTSSLDILIEEENFDPPAENDDQEKAETRLDARIAFSILDKIPKEYREVIMMRCVEELSFKEIAYITEETENTVAVRYHRGLKKVKEIFNQKK